MEDRFLKIMVCCCFWLKFDVFSTEIWKNFSQTLSDWAADVFESLMIKWKYLIWLSSASWLWILSLVWERSSKRSNFTDFSSIVRIVDESNFGNLKILLMIKLKVAEWLLLGNWWRANKSRSASIVVGVFPLRKGGWLVERVFLLAWGRSTGAVGNLIANSCHHVGSLFCAKILSGLTQSDTLIKMRILLGTILCFLLVFSIWILVCLRNGFKVNPGLWGKTKFI